MRILAAFVCATVVFFTTGCAELAAQRRYDRSLPADAPVLANGISALTPKDHLLLKTTPVGFRLADPDGFLVFAVRHSTRTETEAIIARDRRNAVAHDSIQTVHRGAPITVYFARYDTTAMMQVTYFAYLGQDADGILVEYTHNYFKRHSEEKGVWWRTIPPSFSRFLESLEFGPAPPTRY